MIKSDDKLSAEELSLIVSINEKAKGIEDILPSGLVNLTARQTLKEFVRLAVMSIRQGRNDE